PVEHAPVRIGPCHRHARTHVGSAGMETGRRRLVEYATERGIYFGRIPESRELTGHREAERNRHVDTGGHPRVSKPEELAAALGRLVAQSIERQPRKDPGGSETPDLDTEEQ